MAPRPPCISAVCDAVGLLITALQLGQFLPQHYEMAVDKSVVGVSPWLLFFASLYTYLAALDTAMLDALDAATCPDGMYRCFIRHQPLLQMVGSAALSIAMWYWFLKYRQEADVVADPEERKIISTFFYGTVTATAFFNAFLFAAAVFTAASVFLVAGFGPKSSAVVSFAHFCGMLAAVLNALMWVPQIIVTYTFGHKGALSLGWVLASVVMDVTYSVYLAAMGVHWSVWANNVPDGIQTAILSVMLLRFAYRDRRRGIDDFGNIISSPRSLHESNSFVALLKDTTASRSNFV